MKRAFNVFCLASMALALVPIVVSWATAEHSLPLGVDKHISAIDIMTNKVTSDCPCFLASATVFTIGTILLLVSPLASLLQFVGIGVFLMGSPFEMYCGGVYCIFHGDASIGILVAATAAALALVGVVYPQGLTSNRKLVRLKNRFVACSVIA